MPKSATVAIEVKAETDSALRDLKKAEAGLKDLEQAAKDAGAGAAGIDDLTKATKDLDKASQDAGKSGGGISDSMASGMAGGAVVAAASKLSELVSAGFQKMGELASDAFAKALDMQAGRAKLQAQLGLSAEDAGRLGKRAGDLYSQNYGDSLDEVNKAIADVTRNFGLAASEQSGDLDKLTGNVLNFAGTFDQDVTDSVNAVSQLMRTGLAPTAQDALDIITVGFQQGDDKAQDLLDTINEYSTSFRNLGISGFVAMGLISQGIKAGARSSDQVADALKEFGIRSKDASKASADAFSLLGLDPTEMTKKFAKGGDEAAAGLDQVLDALRVMEDPVKQNAAAVGLFGTQAEDLGKALFALDPSEAVKALGEVQGAAEKVSKEVGETAPAKFEAWKRSIETNVVTFLADNVLPGLSNFMTEAQRIFNDVIQSQWFKDLSQTLTDMKDNVLPPLLIGLQGLVDWLQKVADWFSKNEDAMKTLKVMAIGIVVVLGIIIAVSAALVFAVGLLAGALLAISGGALFLLIKAFEGVKAAGQFVIDKIGEMEKWIVEKVGGLATLGKGLWDWLWRGIEDAINTVKRKLGELVDWVRSIPEKIGGALSGIWDKVPKPPSWFPGTQSLMMPGPTLAGVPVPTAGLTAAPRGLPVAAMGGTQVINVTVNHSGLAVDSPRLQRDIVDCLKRYGRRNGKAAIPYAS